MKNTTFGLLVRQGFFIQLFLLSYACSPVDEINPNPTIIVTVKDPIANERLISGVVQGIESERYSIAVYAKINDGWYNMPSRDIPLLSISQDDAWECKLTINDHDNLSKISIFLLPKGYSPPILAGAKAIPLKMNLVSAAKNFLTFAN